jgi:hypothetical protein
MDYFVYIFAKTLSCVLYDTTDDHATYFTSKDSCLEMNMSLADYFSRLRNSL